MFTLFWPIHILRIHTFKKDTIGIHEKFIYLEFTIFAKFTPKCKITPPKKQKGVWILLHNNNAEDKNSGTIAITRTPSFDLPPYLPLYLLKRRIVKSNYRTEEDVIFPQSHHPCNWAYFVVFGLAETIA